MPKIEYRIMGVPSRMDNIKLLWEQLGIGEKETFLDTQYRHNPMWTWKQTVQLPKDEDTSHLCIVQDDTILPLHFKEFVERIAKKYPNSILNLYNHANMDALLIRGSIFSNNTNVGGVCTLIPCEFISPIIEEQEKEYPDFVNDDYWIGHWCYYHKVPLLNTYPSIVDTFESSCLDHGYKPMHLFCEDTQKYHWCNATSFTLWKEHTWPITNNYSS